jgi:hypothetical protein
MGKGNRAMKNLFNAVLLMGWLLAAGCASDSARPSETAQWQYRTFQITSMSEADLRTQINSLGQEGWTFVSLTGTTRNMHGALWAVVMKRPNP